MKKFLLIAAIAVALAGCGEKEGGGDDPVLCKCNPKEHLSIDETCTCGGTDCTNCTLQIYGNVVEKNSANVEGAAIPIYKEVGVVHAQAEIAAGNIIGGYGQLNSSRRNMLFGKIKEFRIVTGANGYVKIGDQYVISINKDTIEDDIGEYLYAIAPSLTMAPTSTRDTIRMAKVTRSAVTRSAGHSTT